MIREIDAVDKEIRNIKENFGCKLDVVDALVRENMKALIKMAAVYKQYYGLNHCSKKDKVIKLRKNISRVSKV